MLNDAKELENDWNPGKWALIWEYSSRAIQWIPTWQGFRWFSKIFAFLCFVRKKPRIRRVNLFNNDFTCKEQGPVAPTWLRLKLRLKAQLDCLQQWMLLLQTIKLSLEPEFEPKSRWCNWPQVLVLILGICVAFQRKNTRQGTRPYSAIPYHSRTHTNRKTYIHFLPYSK